MKHFAFAQSIDTTGKTALKLLDKVNLNVSPDVLQHLPQPTLLSLSAALYTFTLVPMMLNAMNLGWPG